MKPLPSYRPKTVATLDGLKEPFERKSYNPHTQNTQQTYFEMRFL